MSVVCREFGVLDIRACMLRLSDGCGTSYFDPHRSGAALWNTVAGQSCDARFSTTVALNRRKSPPAERRRIVSPCFEVALLWGSEWRDSSSVLTEQSQLNQERRGDCEGRGRGLGMSGDSFL